MSVNVLCVPYHAWYALEVRMVLNHHVDAKNLQEQQVVFNL